MSLDKGNPELIRLRQSIIDTMLVSGSMSKTKAEIRAEVYHALQHDPRGLTARRQNLLENDARKMILAEIVRDYLIVNGLKATLSVFDHESEFDKLEVKNQADSYLESIVPDYIPTKKEGDGISPETMSSKLEIAFEQLEKIAFGTDINSLLMQEDANTDDNTKIKDESS